MAIDFGALANVVLTAVASLALLWVNRKGRARANVLGNLKILRQIRDDPAIAKYPFVEAWLAGSVVAGVAKLTGQPLGPKRKPIPLGAMGVGVVASALLGFFAYRLSQGSYSWTAYLPAVAAGLSLFSVMTMVTDRRLPDDPNLPVNSTRLRTKTPHERIAAQVATSHAGADPSLGEEGGRADVAFKFVEALVQRDFQTARTFADENWLRCRVQNWLWSNRGDGDVDLARFAALAEELIREHSPQDVWAEFSAAESNQFGDAWSEYTSNRIGIASRRRRMSRDYDLVVLPLMPKDGSAYMVTEETAIANALQLLMHEVGGRWLVANHVGHAPPAPGWPPTWWSQRDPTFNDLAE